MKQAIIFQRVEGLVLLIMSLLLSLVFIRIGDSHRTNLVLIYLLLFFTFDISLIGYLRGPKLGALVYNLGHSLIIPLLLLILSFNPYVYFFCLVWVGHIGFDRALGYGLKSTEGFTHTHLGIIGNKKPRD